jgi:hypothetical protein
MPLHPTFRQMYEADEAARTTTSMLLGAVVAGVDDERFIRSALQNVFVETDTSSLQERRGCARAFGRSGAGLRSPNPRPLAPNP